MTCPSSVPLDPQTTVPPSIYMASLYLPIPAFSIRAASPTPSQASTASSESPHSPYFNCSAASSFSDLSDALDEPTLNAKETHQISSSVHPTHALIGPRSFIATFLATLLSLEHTLVYNSIQYAKKGADFTLCLKALGFRGAEIAETANRVKYEFPIDGPISRCWADNAFVSFKCATSALASTVLLDVHVTPNYGFCNEGRGRKAIVEYSSPNIAKPFHVGHLRPTILGAFIRNLYHQSGWGVEAMNYLGDWGTQFALIAVGFAKYGDEEKLEQDPCEHLNDVYVKISADAKGDPSIKKRAAEFFKKLEDKEEDALNWWKRVRELTFARYAGDYNQLNAHFDTFCGESQVGQAVQDQAITDLQRLNLIKLDEGEPGIAKRAILTEWGLGEPVLQKGNGTSIYLSRDLAEAVRRSGHYGFDKMIYVVAAQQDVHLSRVLKILELMQFPWASNGQVQHVNHGLVHGPKDDNGKAAKFSTRNGQVISLDGAIRGIAGRIHTSMSKRSRLFGQMENPSKVAEELAISLLKIHDFSRRRIKNYGADPEASDDLARRRNSGLYIQFTYARLVSLRRRNEQLLPLDPTTIDTSLLDGEDVHHLIFLLAKYPEVISVTLATHQPCKVVNYSLQLCRAIMRLWRSARVLGEPNQDLARARLFMFACSLKVLKSAMELLTLRPQDTF